MTDRPSDSDPPRPADVRRSLRALADGSAPPQDLTDASPTADARPERTVADAERAAECVRAAAAFLSAGRLPDLDRAVAAAARRGDDDVAARGRTARESLRRLDAALSEPSAAPDDHFRSGRGTVLGDTAQRSGR